MATEPVVKKRRAPRKRVDAMKLGVQAALYLDRVVRGLEPADRSRIQAAVALSRPVLRAAATELRREREAEHLANSIWADLLPGESRLSD